MKNIFVYSIFISIIIASCDVIDEPVYPPLGVTYQQDLYGPPPEFEPQSTIETHVLLEDFTGQQCGNCPAANILSRDLDTLWNGRLSVVAIHAGSLAAIGSDGVSYPNDYTTPVGDFYYSQLDFQATPEGRINRLPNVGNFYLPADWTDEVANAMALPCVLDLQIEAEFVEENNHLNTHVYSRFDDGQNGNFRLVILITESLIEDEQLWYGMVPEHVVGYIHYHMLRGTVTGANGETLVTNPEAGFETVTSYTMDWNNEWIAENCSVVAFVFDETTGQIVTCAEVELAE